MIDIQIYMIHAEIFETFVQHVFNVLLPGHAGFYLRIGARQKFGGHNDLIAFGKIPQCPAKILLTCTALVSDRRVEEINAKLQSAANDLACVFLIDRPGMLAVRCVAKTHAPHANAGNLQIRIAKFCVFHVLLLCNIKIFILNAFQADKPAAEIRSSASWPAYRSRHPKPCRRLSNSDT